MEPRNIAPLTTDQTNKLPKWAAQHIRSLEIAIANRDEEIARHTSTKPNPVAIRDYDGPPILWHGDSIIFNGETASILDTISVRSDGPGRIYVSGGRGISIFPSSSNAITVELTNG